MSRIVKCEKGHYYDADKFVSCPHCGVDIKKQKDWIEKSGMSEDLDNVVTVAKNVFIPSSRKRKKPKINGNVEKPPKENLADQITDEMRQVQKITAELQKQNRKDKIVPADENVTVRFELPENGVEPVTGWLVCINGENKGKDYRLKSGFNRIGRHISMDVTIEKDSTVSRDTHCSVAYDGKSNQTFLVPGNGTLTYFKGKMVQEAIQLHSGDEIEIGKNKYIFISFCEGERSWQEK